MVVVVLDGVAVVGVDRGAVVVVVVVVGALVLGVVVDGVVVVVGEPPPPPMMEGSVPPLFEPTIDDRGWPAANSTTVTTNRAAMKTPAIEITSGFHRSRRTSPKNPVLLDLSAPARAALGVALVGPGEPVPATHRGSGTASMTRTLEPTPPDPRWLVSRPALVLRFAASPVDCVSPSRRNCSYLPRFTWVGRDWRTAVRDRSIDACTSAAAVVATALPIATPMIVPWTPNSDAIRAARTAPQTDPMSCGMLSFMVVGGPVPRPCTAQQRVFRPQRRYSVRIDRPARRVQRPSPFHAEPAVPAVRSR